MANRNSLSNQVKLSPLLLKIGKAAGLLKLRAYLVGGAVRDLLTRKKDMDLDIAVEGDPSPLVKAAAKMLKSGIISHPRFGTFCVEGPGGLSLDFATARRETYPKPGALPEVVFSSIEEDLARRDFTINSLALRLTGDKPGEVLDLFGGIEDLRLNRLRVLHGRSFRDDPTRIFRLARFAARDYKIEGSTKRQAAASARWVKHVSAERVAKELFLILGEDNAYAALRLLAGWKITAMVLPGIDISPRLGRLAGLNCLEERLALLFYGLPPRARQRLYGRLRFSNKLSISVERFLAPRKAEAVLDGRDLIKMGYRAGPGFKQILGALAASGIVSRAGARKFVFDNFPQKI